MKRIKYLNKHCQQFAKDMRRAGLKVFCYKGRFGWEGPAVEVKEIAVGKCATDVECQHDQWGMGCLVYPVERERSWRDWRKETRQFDSSTTK